MSKNLFFQTENKVLPLEVLKSLTRGKVISVKSQSLPVPALSVIQNVEENNIYFRIPDELLKSNLFLGDALICQVIDNEYEYVLQGIVGDIQYTYPRELQFSIKKIEIYKNLRKYRRYNAHFTASLLSEKNHVRTYSVVRNISIADLNMVFKDNIDVNTKVDVDVCVDKDTLLKFQARVARVVPADGYTECGMEIVNIDDINKDRLEKVIFQLENDESRFIVDSLK